MRLLLGLLAACAPTDSDAAPVPGHVVLHGAHVNGAIADVELDHGVIVAIGATSAALPTVDLTGRWLVPAFIDSHVHLAYLPEGNALADGGIAAAVDLAAPEAFLAADPAPLRLLRAGPMITAIGGYPTQSWGRDGYGAEVATPAEGVAMVDRLVAAGADLIKVPLTASPTLDDATLRAIVDEAHAKGRKVAVHALSDADAARAAAAGVDVLAHTPTERLGATTLDLWASRAVITTLDAFGGGDDAIANLRALRERGATVLYGTDFGNSTATGVQVDEIAALQRAGLDGPAIVAAGTSTPAAFWGFDGLGALSVGGPASLMACEHDPAADPATLARPVDVWIAGVHR
jgi:imidazolonepropionase-like amidohydrolase